LSSRKRLTSRFPMSPNCRFQQYKVVTVTPKLFAASSLFFPDTRSSFAFRSFSTICSEVCVSFVSSCLRGCPRTVIGHGLNWGEGHHSSPLSFESPRLPMPDKEAVRFVEPASGCRWTIRVFMFVRRKSKQMPRFLAGCVRSPIEAHVTVIAGFKCFSTNRVSRCRMAERIAKPITSRVCPACRCLESGFDEE